LLPHNRAGEYLGDLPEATLPQPILLRLLG
jgi:hypothetical protein